MRREVKIGIFMAGVLAILAVMIFVVGNVSNVFRGPGYRLYVDFDTALGIDKSAAVRMAGIKIGFVTDIGLYGQKARVTLKIFDKYRIPRGSGAGQAVVGLLGEKYIEVRPSEETAFYKPGDVMPAMPSGGFDQLAPMLSQVGNEVTSLAQSLRGLLDQGFKDNLTKSLQNVAALTASIDSLVAANKDRISRSLDGADRTFADLDAQVKSLGESVRGAAGELTALVRDNRTGIGDSVGRIQVVLDRIEKSLAMVDESLRRINEGRGTLGKLINDPAIYEQAQAAVKDARTTLGTVSSLRVDAGVHGDWYGRTEKLKSDFALSVWRGAKFLRAGIVENPMADGFVYSAEAGVRFGPLAPRAGIIESAFGGGLDVYAARDRLVLSLEGFDFNRARSPIFRTTARLYALKNVFLVVGVHDFTLAANRQVFFGLGFGTR